MPQLYGKEGEDRKMGERNCRNLSDIGRYWPASLITARSSLKPSRGAPAYDLTLTEVKHRNDMWEKQQVGKVIQGRFSPPHFAQDVKEREGLVWFMRRF